MYGLSEFIKYLYRDTRGVSAIEYAVIIAFSAAIVTVALTTLGGNLKNTLNTVSSYIGGAGTSNTVVGSTEDASSGSNDEASSDFENSDQSESDQSESDNSSSSDSSSSDSSSSDS